MNYAKNLGIYSLGFLITISLCIRIKFLIFIFLLFLILYHSVCNLSLFVLGCQFLLFICLKTYLNDILLMSPWPWSWLGGSSKLLRKQLAKRYIKEHKRNMAYVAKLWPKKTIKIVQSKLRATGYSGKKLGEKLGQIDKVLKRSLKHPLFLRYYVKEKRLDFYVFTDTEREELSYSDKDGIYFHTNFELIDEEEKLKITTNMFVLDGLELEEFKEIYRDLADEGLNIKLLNVKSLNEAIKSKMEEGIFSKVIKDNEFYSEPLVDKKNILPQEENYNVNAIDIVNMTHKIVKVGDSFFEYDSGVF